MIFFFADESVLKIGIIPERLVAMCMAAMAATAAARRLGRWSFREQ